MLLIIQCFFVFCFYHYFALLFIEIFIQNTKNKI